MNELDLSFKKRKNSSLFVDDERSSSTFAIASFKLSIVDALLGPFCQSHRIPFPKIKNLKNK